MAAATTSTAACTPRTNIAFSSSLITSTIINRKGKNGVLQQCPFHVTLHRSLPSLPSPSPSSTLTSSFCRSSFNSSSIFRAMASHDYNRTRSSLHQDRHEQITTSELMSDFTFLLHRHLKFFCLALTSVAVSAALLIHPLTFDEEAMAAESLTITFPASKIREVTAAQKTLIETWGLIRETYVDPTFNHQDWDLKLGETMSQILPEKTADAAYKKIQSMLATLGDPFTRLVSPQEYQKFKIGNDGALEGVGLLIASDRDTGRLVVISALDGGPAARAGIQSGDELLQIDDEMLAGMDGEKAASKLRGPAGTLVKLKIRRDGVLKDHENTELTEVRILRESITLSPVSTAVLSHMTPDGHLAKTGYLRLTAFSQNAAADMEKAISGLEIEGADSYILDLRNNPGGLVKAGLDVAQMWLDGDEILVNTIDRDGNTLPISLENSHALTHDPLAVLVNGGSASASEILAGALHDNGRAILVGTKTFGKGKIQSVTELMDGSALFVTVAKYLSPSLHEIDQVGITPDVLCSPGDATTANADLLKGASSATSQIEQDSCIVAAEHQLGVF